MNQRQHAALARALIKHCGGLEEAESNCRVSMASLSRYQGPDHTDAMPADVMADLEAYCGKPIYSQALYGAVSRSGTENLLLAVNALDDEAGALRSELIKAMDPNSPGGATLAPVEISRLAKRLTMVGTTMIQVSAALDMECKPAPSLVAE